jgi:phytoene dehydrogenase-like protein
MTERYDAIVIGAGHNGLVAAAYLARAGQRVLVLERRPVLGGAATSEEIFPGYCADSGANDAGLFLDEIVADLGLENFGLEFVQGPVLAFAPQLDGRPLVLWRDPDRAREEIARFSARDAARYPAFTRQVGQFAGLVDAMRRLTPPQLPDYQTGELLPWARVALRLRRLGEREMMEFLRVLPMPVAEYLDEWFETPALKGALGSAGVSASLQGPRGAGTALMMLYQAAGAAGQVRASRFVRGGMLRLVEALAAAARERGAEIRTEAPVLAVQVEAGCARGVTLSGGEFIPARVILSNASPQHTFFHLVGARHFGVNFVREAKNVRYRASTARVALALRELPRFRSQDFAGSGAGYPELLSGHILICPSLDYLERAYDEAKYGYFSAQPFLDATIPTVLDASLAPPGQHLMLVNLQYAPYRLQDGDWERQREELGDSAIATLDRYAPGIGELVLHRLVWTPVDLERQFALPQGDLYHGQMNLDQLLFMRPVAGYGRYRTPVENLFLCGAGAHPGGGVTGAPGYNAAREVLAFLRT